MSDFGGTKAGKVDGGPARCIGPCTYIVEPLLERPLFYQAAGEKTSVCGGARDLSMVLPARGPLGFTFRSDDNHVRTFYPFPI